MLQKLVILASVLLVLVSCGIDEFYYLPQLPEDYITRNMNTEAVINLLPIDEHYYAGSYTIFYRIYLSETNNDGYITQEIMPSISSSLSADYSILYSLTDPLNTTAITSSNTFSNRGFYEVEFDGRSITEVLSRNGGEIRILFPTATGEFPKAILSNGEEIILNRSGKLISPEPRNDRSFRNTSELRENESANANVNADVAPRPGSTPDYAYVSMYIVAAGTNPTTFSPVYSKPTHINVFRLTFAY